MVKRYILKPVFLLAMFLIALLSAGTALAASSAAENSRGLFGTVTAVEESSITVQKGEEIVVLKVDANVKVSIPGVTGPKITDISVGSRVAVVTEQRPDGTYATLISVIAAQSKQQHITITVVEVSGRTVIGETSDGVQIVVELEFDPPADLKGQLATFAGEQPESNRFKAKALLKLQQVVERLEKHVDSKRRDVEAEREQKAKEAKQQELEELKSRLENNLSEHLDRLAEVASKAPPESKEALENALEKIKQGYREAAAALDKTPQDAADLIERRTVVGQVESVDAATRQVGVRTRGDALVNVKATNDTEIRIDEEIGAFSDVRVGDPVQVHYNPKTGVAFRIRLLVVTEVEGLIKAIVPASATGTPALILELQGGATISLSVQPSSGIEVNDRPATIADLAPGMEVEARYNSRTMRLIRVKAQLEAELELTIEQVDLSARTITGHTADGKSITIKVTGKTRMEAKGNLFSILGLQPGAVIEVRIDLGTNEALRITVAEGPTQEGRKEKRPILEKARGTVKFFNERKGLTIILPDKSELTLTIGPSTKITADGQEATPADIQPGMSVTVAYDPQSSAVVNAELHRAPGRAAEQPSERPKVERLKVEGVIIGVDQAQGTLTIFTRKGEKLVLRVFPETNIALNERRLKALSELPAAAAVTVEYTTDGNVAIAIHAEAKQQEEKDKETAERTLIVPHVLETKGTITEVARASGVIVIKTSKGELLKLQVTADTQIVINVPARELRRLGSLSDAASGADVVVQYTSENMALRLVIVQPGLPSDKKPTTTTLKAKGIIKGGGSTGGSPSITIVTEQGTTLTLIVNADTQIEVNEPGLRQTPKRDFGDRAKGASVTVEYTSDGVAVRLVVNEPGLPGERPTPTSTKQSGQVIEKPTPTPTKQSGQVIEKPTPTSTKQPAQSTGRLTPTPTKQSGQVIEKPTPTPTKQAATLKAKGVVKGIAPMTSMSIVPKEGASMTIVTEGGAALTLTLNTTTQIVLNGAVDLAAGDKIEVEYTSDGVAKLINILREVKAATPTKQPETLKAKGIIKGIGTGTGSGGSVTIVTEGGAALTLTVNASTQIAINEEGVQRREASLTDLKVGATVEVEYTSGGVAKSIIQNIRA